MLNSKLTGTHIRSNECVLSIDNLDRLYFKTILTIFREWPYYSIQTDKCFWSIEGSYFNQNVFCVLWNFRELTIDNRWNRTNLLVAIQDKRIYWAIFDKMKILFKFMIFQKFNHSMSVNFLGLIERNKWKIFWVFSYIFEWAFNSIQIMCSNWCILSGSTESIMKLFLSCYKSFVSLLIKSYISQNSSCNEWSNLFYLHHPKITEGSIVICVVGLVNTTEGTSERPKYILKARTSVASVSKSGLLFMQSNL